MSRDDAHFHKSLFERFDIDPRQGPRAITERLRELVEEAKESERDAIRAAWEELTLHPARRLRAAFAAHPESRPPLGAPPPLPKEPAAASVPVTLGELAVRPSIERALKAPERALKAPEQAPARVSGAPGAAGDKGEPYALHAAIGIGASPSLEDDPILKKST
jgi:hypothetical protein